MIEQTFGSLFREALPGQARTQAQDARRFKWTVTDLKTSGAFAHATVPLHVPASGGWRGAPMS
ncbi:hypothetical protein [Deinococcus maricopensis]|uniref:hypothetical protein n=1 Tax=Deinococcus maricopensis TaxID=309887 RepID=UPI00030C3C4D|nr:hypothetical protein [Deinococcus maricopensis]